MVAMATGIREEEDGRQREGREVELTLLTHSGVGACSGRGSGFSSTLVDALGPGTPRVVSVLILGLYFGSDTVVFLTPCFSGTLAVLVLLRTGQ